MYPFFYSLEKKEDHCASRRGWYVRVPYVVDVELAQSDISDVERFLFGLLELPLLLVLLPSRIKTWSTYEREE